MARNFLPSTFLGRILFFTGVLGVVFAGVWYSMQGYRYWRAFSIATETLSSDFERLKTVHRRLGPVEPNSWLASQFERGQTLAEYRTSNPPRPQRIEQGIAAQIDVQAIEIVPLGTFSDGGAKVATLTAEYLKLFFCVPVNVQPAVPASAVPTTAQRRNPHEGQLQYNTRDVLGTLINPRREPGTFLTLVLTQTDLFPLDSWNFVFGEAMPNLRAGIWSMNRFGDPDSSPANFSQVLRRTLRTASHETAHLFGLPHCISYRCNVNGSMHLAEADTQPLEACPSCLEKLTWNTGCDVRNRLEKLIGFARSNGLHEEQDFFQAELDVLQKR